MDARGAARGGSANTPRERKMTRRNVLRRHRRRICWCAARKLPLCARLAHTLANFFYVRAAQIGYKGAKWLVAGRFNDSFGNERNKSDSMKCFSTNLDFLLHVCSLCGLDAVFCTLQTSYKAAFWIALFIIYFGTVAFISIILIRLDSGELIGLVAETWLRVSVASPWWQLGV
jgi:hypothetical protein